MSRDPAIGEILKSVPLLAQCSDDERAVIGGSVREEHYKAGTNLVSQGETGDGFFIIIRGKCNVLRTGQDGVTEKIGTLQDGTMQ